MHVFLLSVFFFFFFFFFFLNLHFQKGLSGIPSECQTVGIQIRPDVLSGLIWVQTVCKGYQKTTKSPLVGKELNGNSKKRTKMDTFVNSVDLDDGS